MFKFKQKLDNFSKAELLLLSKFKKPHAINDYSSHPSWNDVLEMNIEKVIRRFGKLGLLQSATLTEKISYQFTVADLKRLLKKKGLPVSGKKEVLISRLVDSSRLEMEKQIEGIEVFVLSAEGKEVSDQFIAAENKKREIAEALVREALKNKEFDTVSKIVAEYEAQQVFPRGMGIDWNNYDTDRDEKILSLIFISFPKIIKGVSGEHLEQLQFFAAQMYLWGKNNIISNQEIPKQINSHLDVNSASRMILFWALSKRNEIEYRNSGVKKVKIVSYVNDNHVCDYCRKMHNSQFLIDDYPEVPLEKCTCDIGCRCYLEPVY